MTTHYSHQKKMLLAVDCIVFGFNGQELKLLLVQRALPHLRGQWSLMGGFIKDKESANAAAARVLKSLTGLDNVYLEQFQVFSEPGRDPVERTVSVAYFALLNLHNYQQQLSKEYYAEWISINQLPKLIFDHADMVRLAREKLMQKARIQPLLFELLPDNFTLPQLQTLYEAIYDTELDKRNFARKILSAKLLIRQKEKDKSASRRGAFYYKLDKKRYSKLFDNLL